MMSRHYRATDVQYACFTEFERVLTTIQTLLQKALQNSAQNALQNCGEACKGIKNTSLYPNSEAKRNYEIMAGHFAKLCKEYGKIKALLDDINSPGYALLREAIRNSFDEDKLMHALVIVMINTNRPYKADAIGKLKCYVS